MIDKLYKLVFISDLHATRIILAISEFIWGLSLLMPGETFTRSKTYSGMHLVADEWIWGIVWLISGVIQAYIVISGEYHNRFAVWFAGINTFLWLSVTASLYTCVWPMNSVASADAALCLAAAWVWIRSGWIPKPIRGCEKWIQS